MKIKSLGALWIGCLCLMALDAAGAVKVLVISGQNNHNWKKTTPLLVDALGKTGRFKVTVKKSKKEITAWTA